MKNKRNVNILKIFKRIYLQKFNFNILVLANGFENYKQIAGIKIYNLLRQ